MTIGIDIRSINDSLRGGVSEYTSNLLEALFRVDKKNSYVLFNNAWKSKNQCLEVRPPLEVEPRQINFHYPNKLFNLSLRFLKLPKIDKMLEKAAGKKIDLFFIPNLNFISLSKNCRKVLVIHDLSFEIFSQFFSRKRQLWHKLIRPCDLVNSADQIIAISENTKNDLIELYRVAADRINVIHPGICGTNDADLHASDVNLRIKYDLPEKFILYLGTLEPRKNIEGLIRAFEKLQEEYRNIEISKYRLVIAGQKGWLWEKIIKLAKSSPVGDKIIFTGYVSRQEKLALYRRASVFVYPSFYEGFGFPPLEAAREGTPTIVSANSSFFETLGDATLLINPHNPVEIAQAIHQILTEEKLENKLIEKGKEAALRFSWEKCAKETLQVFEKASEYENRH